MRPKFSWTILKLGVCSEKIKLIEEVNKTSTVFVGVFVERELKFLRAQLGVEIATNYKTVMS